MSGAKLKRQIKKLLQLFSRYDIPFIYIEDIADYLECSRDLVEHELCPLYEEGVLKPVFNAHCGVCGNIMGTYESSRDLAVGMGIAECPYCMNQQKVLANDLVNAWAVCKETEDETDSCYDNTWTVISSKSYLIMGFSDDGKFEEV